MSDRTPQLQVPRGQHRVEVARFTGKQRTHSYEGVLISPLEVGRKMVVLLPRARRLMTSVVEQITDFSGRLMVKTGGSTYLLQYLGRAPQAYDAAAPAAA